MAAGNSLKQTKSVGKALSPVQLLQLKVTLFGVNPPIWRRIVVPDRLTFVQLHAVLQVVFQWGNCHLWCFEAPGVEVGIPDPETDDLRRPDAPPVLNARRVKLGTHLREPGQKWRYTYDFGDDWQVDIVVEGVTPAHDIAALPVCLEGKRAGPPEDVGGIHGFREFLSIVDDPKHAEHAETLEWVGGEWDAERFDVEEINAELRDEFIGLK